MGLNATTVLWWRYNPLYIGLVYKHRKNVDALPDRSHFALWALALDPDCDFLYPGRHEPHHRRGDLGQATGAPRHPSGRGRPPSARLALSGQIRCECGRKLIIHRMKGNRTRAVRCQACGWLRSYKYAENTILSAIALLRCSISIEREVEAEIAQEARPDADGGPPGELTRRRDQMARKLTRRSTPARRRGAVTGAQGQGGGAQNAVAELDREIAAETATLKGRTAVGEWRSARRYLLDIDVPHAVGGIQQCEEQREVLGGVFSEIVATPEHLIFHVTGSPSSQWRSPGKPPGRSCS